MELNDEEENSYRPRKKLTRMERLYGQRRYNLSRPQTYSNLLTKSTFTFPTNQEATYINKTIKSTSNNKKPNLENDNHDLRSFNYVLPENNSFSSSLPCSQHKGLDFFDQKSSSSYKSQDMEMDIGETNTSQKSIMDVSVQGRNSEDNMSLPTHDRLSYGRNYCEDDKTGTSKTNEKEIDKDFVAKKNKSKVKEHHEFPKFVTASNKDPTTIDRNSIKKVARNETNVSKDPVATSLMKNAPSNDDKDDDDNTIIKEGPLKGCEKHLVEIIEREVMHVKEKITWESICGLEKEKDALMEAVVWPMIHPEIFDPYLRKPDKGILLFGPPGTGKTMLARCVASQSKATFFNVSSSSLASKWHGEAEKLVRTLFTVAAAKAPSVVFIDEIDSFLSKRSDGEAETARKVKTEFLIRMDGIMANFNEKRVMILAASNKACEIDEAARRRFTKRLLISLPSAESRKSIIDKLITDQHFLTDGQFEKLVNLTEGFSGADVAQLCTEASMYAIREMRQRMLDPEPIPLESIRKISFLDFEKALKTVKATVSEDEAKSYNDFAMKFASNFKN